MLLPLAEVRARWAAEHPGLDTSPMEIVGLIRRIHLLHERALRPLHETAPVTPPELDLLIPLRHAPGPVIARRLAANLGISRVAVSKSLARLEERGHIRRTPSAVDRRSVEVVITDAGRAVVDALFPRLLAREVELLAGLGEDREKVVAALTRLAEVLAAADPDR
ncbi:putative transcriptional regulator, MarR family protein [Embleya hyalina]|uniref:Putative transcriptional regulator, MarR family protein n=1 Tax=Embleya hyalina TaxID=516124 RepID=A0A401Z6P2_9ACTN|nr:putative transcriptional regulator, MarR family protein [Embleya hyalina]